MPLLKIVHTYINTGLELQSSKLNTGLQASDAIKHQNNTCIETFQALSQLADTL